LQWVNAVGGAGADFCYDVDVAPDGDIVVTGYYEGAVDFGTGPLLAYGDRDV
ncbi:MAG: hypothetical protein GWN73_43890, partial [Actinobacteria bacterium]|nr:hypothetical protein [Actinomycetota bacterium]NIU71946.1 hypothetical protein [Actinomycetota bacterium]